MFDWEENMQLESYVQDVAGAMFFGFMLVLNWARDWRSTVGGRCLPTLLNDRPADGTIVPFLNVLI